VCFYEYDVEFVHVVRFPGVGECQKFSCTWTRQVTQMYVYVTFVVMSHIFMYTWVVSHIYSHMSHKWVVSHIHVCACHTKGSCHTYICICGSCHTYIVICHTNGTRQIHMYFMSHFWVMSHAYIYMSHMWVVSHIYRHMFHVWVMSHTHIRIRHVTHVYGSCHAHR